MATIICFCLLYTSGFTGSVGTALITGSWAGVWTDGRYFVQAAAELKDTGVELMKMGQPGVLSLEDYLEQLPDGITLGFDGRVINGKMGEDLKERLEEKKITLDYHAALVDEIWEDRPPLSAEPIWILEEKYAGKSAKEKIAQLRAEMEQCRADLHIITTLDDICLLYTSYTRTDGRYPLRIGRICIKPVPTIGYPLLVNYVKDRDGSDYNRSVLTSRCVSYEVKDHENIIIVHTNNCLLYTSRKD